VKIVIVGCGRVGAELATAFDGAGNDVVVLDLRTDAFDRLPSSFRGSAVRGDGTDEDVLERAGARGADVFIAMTEGDNRNVMAAQLAHEAFDVRRVIAKINDPVRAEAYADLGIADPLSDEPDVRRDQRLPGAADAAAAGRPRPDREPSRRRAPRAHERRRDGPRRPRARRAATRPRRPRSSPARRRASPGRSRRARRRR
jgi:trk system potassium uptake protein TrkA